MHTYTNQYWETDFGGSAQNLMQKQRKKARKRWVNKTNITELLELYLVEYVDCYGSGSYGSDGGGGGDVDDVENRDANTHAINCDQWACRALCTGKINWMSVDSFRCVLWFYSHHFSPFLYGLLNSCMCLQSAFHLIYF